MIEIIERSRIENEYTDDNAYFKHSKQQLTGGNVQVSYNSHGHLVVRLMKQNGSDTLIVFDAKASREIIEFCQERLSGMAPF